jgi:coenzyme F420 hydrogenase subunit beta
MARTNGEGETMQRGVPDRSFPNCCYCGACAAFIPDFERFRADEVVVEKGCGGTVSKGFCFSFCPRSFAVCRLCEEECPRLEYGVCDFSPSASSPERRILGYYQEIISARATDRSIRGAGKDGGVITALLYEGLASGFIDAAVVAIRTADWRPEPFVATTPEEVLLGRGPKYTACPSVQGLWEAIDRGYEQIAVVGTGCNIEAVRRLQALRDRALELERVKVLIGVFSTEAFWHSKLVQLLAEREGIAITEVERFFVSRGQFVVVTRDREVGIPLNVLDQCTRDTCSICEDASSQLADISAGSVGSPDGWTTVIIRTDVGKEFIQAAAASGVIETNQLGPAEIEVIERFALRKKTRNYGRLKDQMAMCEACLTNPFPFTLQRRGGGV